ncbi:unnamed protein product [Urochloa decumbens]|uniref:Uncharacterized protein n=1 Tax=Urochloa decumbens TaxID=240449 RepID=A0ABC9A988_9POAL
MAAGPLVVDFPSMGAALCFNSLESLIRDSASGFLAAVSAAPAPGAADLTNFHRVFSRVLSGYPDPPLEAVWFFSALTFHDRPDDLRSLLQLLSAFAASSPSAAKPLALLAPVVSELFHSDKTRRETEALVEAVLSYISICSSRAAASADGASAEAGRLLPAFGELVKVWSVRHSKDRCPFQVLFPIAGEEARRELMKEGCSVEYLAGVVVAEAFLLRLCLKVQNATGLPRAELQKELKIWAVSSIPVFQNHHFFGVLLNMLLNSPLPVYSLLSADDEILVRDVLYDALILVDYSFINNVSGVDQADLLRIYLSRLIITLDAVNDARRKGDQGRAMSFINVFSTSNVPNYLIKWATCKAGVGAINKPIANTPQALLKWLVDLEEKGLKVFGDDSSWIKGRLICAEVKNGYGNRMIHSDADLFFIDKQSGGEVMDTKGSEDEEAVEMEATGNAFMAAAQSMKVEANGIRKRKGCGNEDAAAVKFVKYKVEDSSAKDYFLSANNGMSSGSEVENPQSDDEMEESD